jgi:hypothetical protein
MKLATIIALAFVATTAPLGRALTRSRTQRERAKFFNDFDRAAVLADVVASKTKRFACVPICCSSRIGENRELLRVTRACN